MFSKKPEPQKAQDDYFFITMVKLRIILELHVILSLPKDLIPHKADNQNKIPPLRSG